MSLAAPHIALDRLVEVRPVESFDDPVFAPATYDRLLRSGDTDTVFQSAEWMRAWRAVFDRGRLLTLSAERDGVAEAVAPFYVDGGMVFFVGSGGADYLDFIGRLRSAGVLESVLDAAISAVDDFVGFKLYHVPDRSETGSLLQRAAARLGLACFDEGHHPAPALEAHGLPAALSKKSLKRHERFFLREGLLEVRHLVAGEDIHPHLDAFFDQHVGRWKITPYPSLFEDAAQRRFYERLTAEAGRTGWLRFTRLDWNGEPIAFHYGFQYRGTFMWYKPSFDVGLSRRSPGEVLLKKLLEEARDGGAELFDFGIGDEAFKDRFATHRPLVRNWGLYRRDRL